MAVPEYPLRRERVPAPRRDLQPDRARDRGAHRVRDAGHDPRARPARRHPRRVRPVARDAVRDRGGGARRRRRLGPDGLAQGPGDRRRAARARRPARARSCRRSSTARPRSSSDEAPARLPAMPRFRVDLRSDTVSTPSEAMRAAMASAEVGDAWYGDDPTVNRLQDRAAELTGMEAGALRRHRHDGQPDRRAAARRRAGPPRGVRDLRARRHHRGHDERGARGDRVPHRPRAPPRVHDRGARRAAARARRLLRRRGRRRARGREHGRRLRRDDPAERGAPRRCAPSRRARACRSTSTARVSGTRSRRPARTSRPGPGRSTR